MSLKPGDTYYGEFTTSVFSTGAAANADSLPAATLVHNGTDDSDNSPLTVTNAGTGYYTVTGTIYASYAAGDAIQIRIAATVSSVAGVAVIDSFVLDSKRVGDLNDISVANIWNAVTSGMSTASSIGLKLKTWVLGTDNKVLISTDVQDLSSTLTVATEGSSEGGGLTAQEVRDALKLAPSSGSPASGSIDAKLSAIPTNPYTGTPPTAAAIRAEIDSNSTQLAALISAAFGKITVSGNTYTFYASNGTTPVHTITIADTGRTVT